ncbi:hypothetical protein DERF_002399 [Dermatophagoides farinae]|uniref:Uncharacterized protein n=1 Tax=Dermatophagoides farinae TaxID=6954 RepID=A0A922ID03_DERFA|nr:hypothetical protein DERF_002399 [Dermatophagoides farinae]
MSYSWGKLLNAVEQFVQLRSRSRFQRNAFCASAHVAAAFASNRWCSHSIEHRKSSNSNFSN